MIFWRRSLLWHVIAGLVAFASMAESPSFFYGFILSGGDPSDVSGYSNAFMVASGAILAGIAIAACQMKILRAYHINAQHWMIASVAGFSISFFLVWLFSGAANSASYALHAVPHAVDGAGISGGLIIGASLGLSQWVVLRNHFSHSFIWIMANAAGFALGWQLAALQPTTDQIAHFVGASVIGLAWGILSTGTLSYFRKQN